MIKVKYFVDIWPVERRVVFGLTKQRLTFKSSSVSIVISRIPN